MSDFTSLPMCVGKFVNTAATQPADGQINLSIRARAAVQVVRARDISVSDSSARLVRFYVNSGQSKGKRI